MRFQDLPKEIIQLIAAYLDDKSVLNVRLIDTTWFNSIKNIHFPVYLPRSATLPDIINSLSRYDTPISLTIHKPRRISLREFIQQIAKLSNLTSLTFPYFSDFEHDLSRSGDQPDWQLLTNLTNLRELTLLKPNRLQDRDQLSAPEEFLRALVHLPHLATLQLTNCNYTRQELDKYVTLLTKLEDLSVPMIPTSDLLPSISSHLTRLCFTLPKIRLAEKISELNIYQNLKELQLLGINLQHLCLSGISSLETLEVSAKRVTGIDNNTKLRHLLITVNDSTIYDQIRSLRNLNWLHIDMKAENTDPQFFSEFNKLTYLYILMQRNYELWNISSSVKNLTLELEISNFNYASLAVLTSLDTLTVGTMSCHAEKTNYLADVSALTRLTDLTVLTYDNLRLANLSTLTNLERLHAGACLSIERLFLPHLTNLRAFSNNKLQQEHYLEIAKLTRLTHLGCLNAEDTKGDYSELAHLPLKIFAADVLKEDMNSFLQVVSTMTSLELLAVFNDKQKYECIDQEMHADWSLLSTLTHLTRLDLDISGVTSDTLTSLTRVTSLQCLNVMKPEEEYTYSDDEDDEEDDQNTEDDWTTFAEKFPLISVSYVDSAVYTNPLYLSKFEPK